MDDEEQEQSSFKVTDRRQFTDQGEVRDPHQPDSGEQAPPQKEEPPKASPEKKAEESQEPSQKEEAEPTGEQDPGQGSQFLLPFFSRWPLPGWSIWERYRNPVAGRRWKIWGRPVR